MAKRILEVYVVLSCVNNLDAVAVSALAPTKFRINRMTEEHLQKFKDYDEDFFSAHRYDSSILETKNQ